MEQTLILIKPDGVKKHLVGEILKRFEGNGLDIRAIKLVRINRSQAEGFYQVHKDQPFFEELVQFMTSGPIIACVLEGERAITRVRQIMGGTDPKKAEKGTIRNDFADSIRYNIIHGSDSKASADYEIPNFFNRLEIIGIQAG